MIDDELLYVELFNIIYKKYGFKGVLEEIDDRLEYGKVSEENGLYCITTGGWSDDEELVDCLIHPHSKFHYHYCGYIVGGAFYFCEDKSEMNVEMVKVVE